MSPAGGLAEASAPATRLRTVFCTRGGRYGALVLQRLRSCQGIELCGIVHSARVLDPRFGWLRGALALIRRCGLAYALYLWCATTLADWLEGAAAAVEGASIFTTRDINAPAGLEFLARCRPDLLVSAFFDQRLGITALALPNRGCVNIHPSLLPYLRGVDPVLQARLAGSDALGVTVHWMVPALDEGAVLAQRAVSVPPGASVFAMTAALFSAGADLLASSLERIARRDPGVPQGAHGSYQSWPTRAEVRTLHALGIPLMRFADFRQNE